MCCQNVKGVVTKIKKNYKLYLIGKITCDCPFKLCGKQVINEKGRLIVHVH